MVAVISILAIKNYSKTNQPQKTKNQNFIKPYGSNYNKLFTSNNQLISMLAQSYRSLVS